MLFSAAILVFSFSNVAYAAAPAPLTCATVPISLLTTPSQFTAFCAYYLGLHPVTTTSKPIPTVIRTSTIATVISGVNTVPTGTTVVTATTTTTATTVTPQTSLTTTTKTSTAYLDNSGNTIFFARRDIVPTPMAKRAIVAGTVVAVPQALLSYNRADLVTICTCPLNVGQLNSAAYVANLNNGQTSGPGYAVASTITRTIAQRPTVTFVTRTFTRSINTRTTSTLTTLTTLVNTRVATITAPAPVSTMQILSFWPSSQSCPPGYAPAFLCPEGTGFALPSTDPAFDTNYITCPVFSEIDFYGGTCLYWFDNGQPGTSTLALASGIATGDSTLDYTRPAVYGNVLSDDCPSWSDYTCSIVAGTGTSTLSVIAAAPVRRSMSSEDIASMKKRATRATRIKQKMPPHIPGTRGSKYVHTGKL